MANKDPREKARLNEMVWSATAGAFGGWTIALYLYSAAAAAAGTLLAAVVAAVAAIAGVLRSTDLVARVAEQRAKKRVAAHESDPQRKALLIAAVDPPDAEKGKIEVGTLAALAVGFAVGTTLYALYKERVNLLPPPAPAPAKAIVPANPAT